MTTGEGSSSTYSGIKFHGRTELLLNDHHAITASKQNKLGRRELNAILNIYFVSICECLLE